MTATYERAVRFEDVDAARLVFFARYFGYCHEALEALFAPMEGGYARVVLVRGIGFPSVHVEADYMAPLRYGDGVRIATYVLHVGRTSCRLRYDMSRTSDGARIAKVEQVVVVTNLATIEKIAIPDDVRALFESHRVEAA